MTIQQKKIEIKKQIEKLAKESNVCFLVAASAFQSAAVKSGGDEFVPIIGELKLEFVGLA